MQRSNEWKKHLLEWGVFLIAVMLIATLFVVAGADAVIEERDLREARYCDVYGAEINGYYGKDYCYVSK